MMVAVTVVVMTMVERIADLSCFLQVLQTNGGVGILGVHTLFVLLQLHLPPATATPNDVSDEGTKSLTLCV